MSSLSWLIYVGVITALKILFWVFEIFVNPVTGVALLPVQISKIFFKMGTDAKLPADLIPQVPLPGPTLADVQLKVPPHFVEGEGPKLLMLWTLSVFVRSAIHFLPGTPN